MPGRGEGEGAAEEGGGGPGKPRPYPDLLRLTWLLLRGLPQPRTWKQLRALETDPPFSQVSWEALL